MDLFDHQDTPLPYIPLAEKMRPRSLDQFFGHKHLIGEGKLLSNLIVSDKLTSMILQGPPSSGKTSLAHIIRNHTQSEYIQLNAVSLTIAEIRDMLHKAKDNQRLYHRKTIVFIDEIHALKSNVQSALLPAVEDGTVILIGATTESVMHDLIPPLVSRCRVYHLEPLAELDLIELIHLALKDNERGLGHEGVTITEEAAKYLADVCNRDVRNALNALEAAAQSAWDTKVIDLDRIKEAYQLRLNNTSTTDYYNLVSAFIKSMRAGHTDGALYWLARMLYVGVDPVYIARRIVVHSVEDVGMANPNALQVAVAAKQAVEFIGMPEARLPLAEAVVYICESPKSNSVYKAINAAMELVKQSQAYDVPSAIQNGSKQYVNPIDHPRSRLEYLPKELNGTCLYHPQDAGVEAKIHAKYRDRER